MEAVDLHQTLDARVWAKEFCKRWPSALCQIPGHEGVSDGDDLEGVMIGWFANAIMTGYDQAKREAEPASGGSDNPCQGPDDTPTDGGCE